MPPLTRKKLPVRRVPIRRGERIGPVEDVDARLEDVETPVLVRGGVRTRGGGLGGARGGGRGRGGRVGVGGDGRGGGVRTRGGHSVRSRANPEGESVAEDDRAEAVMGAEAITRVEAVMGAEVVTETEIVTEAEAEDNRANVENDEDNVEEGGAITGFLTEAEDGRDSEDELVLGNELDEDEVENENAIGVREETCQDLVVQFGTAAEDDKNESDEDSGDDIWDDERIPDPLSSDSEEDEEGRERRRERRRQNDDPDELALGKTFNCPEDFKMAVLRYSLKTRYDVKLYKSQSAKIGAKCNNNDCPWRVYCSYEKRRHKMQVKVYVNGHICVRSGYSSMMKSSTIAWLFSERLRVNPKFTKQEMASEIRREYNLIVSDDQCSKAKSKVLRERKANHEEHFSRVWDYQAEIFHSNANTKFEIETTPGATVGSKQRFYRCYICFSAQQQAWKNTCRPIIGLDGAFLKWDVKGHLLAAVGRDGDNRIVPIAWAVVEVENDPNWDWFIRQLAQSLDLGYGNNVAIISDKHKLQDGQSSQPEPPSQSSQPQSQSSQAHGSQRAPLQEQGPQAPPQAPPQAEYHGNLGSQGWGPWFECSS